MTGLDNEGGQGTAGRDEPRPVATGLDTDYALSIDEVAERYAQARHPRTIRTLQRYCVSGHLDCRKVATTYGDKFLVAPYSVSRHIAQVNEMTMDAASRGAPWPVATAGAAPTSIDAVKNSLDAGATDSDQSRPPTTGNDNVPEPECAHFGNRKSLRCGT